jgi:hypothetical protein
MVSLLAVAAWVTHPATAFAGHPQPYEFANAFRQANIAFLEFQNALANKQWEAALALCSERVREQAGKSSSAEEFFRTTMPFEKVFRQFRFEFYREQHNGDHHSYGMFIRLTDPAAEPVVDWFWSISTAGGRWLIDFEPKPFDQDKLIAQHKAEHQAYQARVAEIRRALEPKLRGIKTHLTPLGEKLVVGSPMHFRLEVMNLGDDPVNYVDSGSQFRPLMVWDRNRRPVPFEETPSGIPQRQGKLSPRSSVVLGESVDLARHYKIERPGKYYVQFDGSTLDIGTPIDEHDVGSSRSATFIAATDKFPSNIVEIEVIASNRPND